MSRLRTDEVAAVPDVRAPKRATGELQDQLDRRPPGCRQAVDEEADADMDALAARQQPAEHGEPDHQESGRPRRSRHQRVAQPRVTTPSETQSSSRQKQQRGGDARGASSAGINR